MLLAVLPGFRRLQGTDRLGNVTLKGNANRASFLCDRKIGVPRNAAVDLDEVVAWPAGSGVPPGVLDRE